MTANVSDADRRAMARQAAVLRRLETDDEGSVDDRAAVLEWADQERTALGIDRLHTEGELHRRARALGLVD